jgi:hypothetical protein
VPSRAIVIKSSGVFAPNPDVRGLESDAPRAPHPQYHRRPEMSAEPRHIASIDVRGPPDTFVDVRA